jgi:CDP-diglyceride synthetase
MRADALAHSGHGYLGDAPLALMTCLLVLGAALVFRALAGFRGQPRQPAASPAIVLLSPAAFIVQEHVERVVHSGQMPWTAALQPSFLLGLALQLPFALAALLIAWVLDSAAHAVGRALAEAPPRPHLPVLAPLPAYETSAPRPAGLARGYGERAPPLLRRP